MGQKNTRIFYKGTGLVCNACNFLGKCFSGVGYCMFSTNIIHLQTLSCNNLTDILVIKPGIYFVRENRIYAKRH